MIKAVLFTILFLLPAGMWFLVRGPQELNWEEIKEYLIETEDEWDEE